jgi:MFS family permease
MLKNVEYKYIVALVAVFSIFMELLDTTIVNVAIPTLQTDFGVDKPSTIQWVITGNLLSLVGILSFIGVAVVLLIRDRDAAATMNTQVRSAEAVEVADAAAG